MLTYLQDGGSDGLSFLTCDGDLQRVSSMPHSATPISGIAIDTQTRPLFPIEPIDSSMSSCPERLLHISSRYPSVATHQHPAPQPTSFGLTELTNRSLELVQLALFAALHPQPTQDAALAAGDSWLPIHHGYPPGPTLGDWLRQRHGYL